MGHGNAHPQMGHVKGHGNAHPQMGHVEGHGNAHPQMGEVPGHLFTLAGLKKYVNGLIYKKK